MSVLATVFKPSLVLSSLFSCWIDALSSWSWVFTAWSLAFSSSIRCLSSLNWVIMISMSSVWAFFLSLAVCAATRFFNFLLISLSSGLKWSRFALFLTGHSSSSFLMSNAMILSGEIEGAGLLLPTTVAIGLAEGLGLAMFDISVAVGRTDLLMGVNAGGVEVTIVRLNAWGLDVITLYGEICFVGLGEILNKDFCWFWRKLCGITIICGALDVCILNCFIFSCFL